MPTRDEDRNPLTGQKKGWGYSGSYEPTVKKGAVGGKQGRAFTAQEIAAGAGKFRVAAKAKKPEPAKAKKAEPKKKKTPAKSTKAKEPKKSYAMIRAESLAKSRAGMGRKFL